MKQVLVLGAGLSASYLVAQLLEDAQRQDWFVTVGDRDQVLAREAVGNHARGEAVRFDVNDAGMRSTRIAHADIVINMLPAAYQDLVAWDCVNHGRQMVSVSYRDQAVRDLDLDAKRKGVMLLCGGRVVRFRSYGSGIPAPNQPQHRLRYAVTWDPRNVVMAGFEGAQYMEDGNIKIVPFHHVFNHTWNVDVDGIGRLEAYANRDSMSYMESFGLEHVRTMIRGTLRYAGWSETWGTIVRLGLPNETLRIPQLADRTYAEVMEMFLPLNAKSAPLEQRVATFLRISPTGGIMENLRWLGLFSDERIGCKGDTAAAMLIHLLQTKLPLTPEMRDMVVLVHELDVEYPGDERSDELIRSTLVVEGEAGVGTAMARSVGLPVLIAVKLMLRGELSLTGCLIPTHPAIYTPVLRRIESAGLRFTESRTPIGDS